MRVPYRTAKATLLQLILGSLLVFVSGGASIVLGCQNASGADCVSNTFVSLILMLLFVVAYGLLFGLGLWAQEQRSSRLAFVLVSAEACAIIFFVFDAKQAPDLVERLANGGAALLATWAAFVAFNLFRSRGARIVQKRSAAKQD